MNQVFGELYYWGGGGFRKSKVQNIFDDHKIGIFQFPMVYMELKAKTEYSGVLENITWVH